MNLQEYQAKQLLAKYGVVVPLGGVATSPSEVEEIAKKFPGPWVMKAQVHTGGRGKAGGVRIIERRDQIKPMAEQLIGKVLMTHQSGLEGRVILKALVEEKIIYQKECYLALTVDREKAAVSILASPHGGIQIEEMIQKYPDQLWVEVIDPLVGVLSYQVRHIAKALEAQPTEVTQLDSLLKRLYRVYTESELSLLEINPLVFGNGKNSNGLDWIALDAKMTMDDNALFRHQDLEALRDMDEEDPLEVDAAKYGLSYIRLEGNIGCMVNGAGLAMATLDEIKNEGLDPADFLDIGGGASSERVARAIEIITSDSRVQIILINIFGGITQCDQVAQGVIDALRGKKKLLPMVVRLEGTRVEEGRKLLQATSLPIIPVANLKEAARQIKSKIQMTKSKTCPF